MEYQRIWLLVLFCLSSWDMHAQHFVIEGKTNGYVPDGSILYLGRWNGMGAMIYFTSDMIRNGTFRLKAKEKRLRILSICTEQKRLSVHLTYVCGSAMTP